ncbi:MAG: hypothetical protein U0W24_20730 [Bacteroidales bacterium]
MENELILVSPKTIKAIVISALEEFNTLQNERTSENRLFTINKASKILGVSHATVKKLVANETLKTTPDNKITEKEINRYLSA